MTTTLNYLKKAGTICMVVSFFCGLNVYAATKKNVMTVKVYHDINKDGEKQDSEPWLVGIEVLFEYTGEDGYFDGGKDPLRPQNDDAIYTKKTDTNGSIVINPGGGVLYASLDPKDFSFLPKETKHLNRINYEGKIDEWIVGVIPAIDQAAEDKKEAEVKKKAEEEKKKAEAEVVKKKEEAESDAKKKKEEEAKKKAEAEAIKKKEAEAAAKKKTEQENQIKVALPSTNQCVQVDYARCAGGKLSGFFAYAERLACEQIIKKKSTCEDYKCERDISKAEVVGIGLKMARVDIPKNYACKNRFIDASGSMPSWICRAAELGLENKIASAKDTDTKFNPHQKLNRTTTYDHLMRSVCMPVEPVEAIKDFSPSLSYSDWEKRIIRTAQKYELTTRSDENFRPSRSIYRQELFILASKLLDWAQETGGCHQKNMCK